MPLVRRLMADHPWIDARLLIGDERISENPKLNNVFKGWREAAYPLVSICDSNVLLPRDYIQRLFDDLRSENRPCLLAADRLPAGRFLRRSRMRDAQQLSGALAILRRLRSGSASRRARRCSGARATSKAPAASARSATKSAEDAACTKIVRNLGLRVRLMQPPVRQPLGVRRAIDVWKRQRRWARLRRASFPFWFSLEIFSGALPPLAALIAAAMMAGIPALAPALIFLAVWYGAEWLLSVKAGWHHLAPVGRNLHAARPDAARALRQCLARPRLRVARQRHAGVESARLS